MSCDEGYSFSAKAVTIYGCGPDTNWKWNGVEKPVLPKCSSKAAPKQIELHFSIKFPGLQCNILRSLAKLYAAVEKVIRDMLLAVQGCHACKLKDVATPGCDSLANTKKRRAIDPAMEVLFSLVVNSSSPGDDVEERSEAVLFQVQYAVATGQFQISLNGTNSTADRSSLQHLFSNVTCAAGSVTSADRKGCVACPVETSYDKTSSKCVLCGKGSYQDKEGQASCIECDEGKSTDNLGGASSEECVKGVLSNKVPREGKNTAVYITVSFIAVIAMIGIVATAAYCRYRRFCCVAKNKVGQSNPSLEKYHVAMEKREALQQMNTESCGVNDSVYSEMPEKRLNNFINCDAVAGDKLNTANVTSPALYANDNDLDSLFENPVAHDQSQESKV